jgi:hypothetical protein
LLRRGEVEVIVIFYSITD